MPAAEKTPPGKASAKKGTIYTTPQGERRLRLCDVVPPKRKIEEGEVEVTLHQILFNGFKVEGNDGRVLVFRPLNLKAFAAIEDQWESFENLAVIAANGKIKMREMIKLITILINQDLDEDKEVSEDQVARAIPGDSYGLINMVLDEIFRPLSKAPATAEGTPGNARDAGPASSTSSPSTSAGSREKLSA